MIKIGFALPFAFQYSNANAKLQCNAKAMTEYKYESNAMQRQMHVLKVSLSVFARCHTISVSVCKSLFNEHDWVNLYSYNVKPYVSHHFNITLFSVLKPVLASLVMYEME